MPRSASRLLLILAIPLLFSGCFLGTPGKALVTPLTVVRDVVDAPLISLSSVFNHWGSQFNPLDPPQPGVGWSWRGGFGLGITYGLGYFVFKGLTGVVGGVDYVVCRSLYPAWPHGLRPWKKKDQSWGDLYFPNTRALWGTHPPDTIWDIPAKAGPEPPEATKE
jgi:hypothetical protein